VTKTSKSKLGGKLPRTIDLQRHVKNRKALELATGAAIPRPNMSRRPPTNILYAFPHFDRCDSLLYFSNSLTRHLNSGDVDSLKDLLFTHLDKNCSIGFNFGHGGRYSCEDVLSIWNKVGDLEPDRVMCVHATQVVGNTIRSTVYSKVTDSQPLCSYMADQFENAPKPSMYSPNRAERLLLYTNDHTDRWTGERRKQLLELANTDEDILLYMKVEMVLVVNDMNKIVSVDCFGGLTSAHAAVKSVSYEDIFDST